MVAMTQQAEGARQKYSRYRYCRLCEDAAVQRATGARVVVQCRTQGEISDSGADGPGWWAQAYFTHTSASFLQRSSAVKGQSYRVQTAG